MDLEGKRFGRVLHFYNLVMKFEDLKELGRESAVKHQIDYCALGSKKTLLGFDELGMLLGIPPHKALHLKVLIAKFLPEKHFRELLLCLGMWRNL
ncbi:hypothetical protein RIF29_04100 [Crotalaria pallida]|uniref:Uncharacterized protein n=1 Tax=Crotalaria pallida TaxID=3830 RepID=A0AAN9J0P5_CROPI